MARAGRLPGQGRPNTPTRLKVLRGERHRDRLNFNEPHIDPGEPDKPDDLSKLASDVWDESMPDVLRMDVIAPTDKWMYAAYCESVARFRETTSILKKIGVVMKTPDGQSIKANPFLSAQRDSIVLMVRLAAEFGLTPRARSEIQGRNNDSDSREALLS